MPRQLWIPDALRAEGVAVVEVDGADSRGSSSFDPFGVLGHHTAGPSRGDMPSLRTLIVGRSDLAGPLAQIGLARSGIAYFVAAGKANHAGPGRWLGITSGGTHFVGIEAENTGLGEPWPAPQVEAYDLCIAAILRHEGRSADWYAGHREWALPKGRKIDPKGIDLAAQRDRVRAILAHPPKHHPPTTTPAPEDPTPMDNARLESIDKKLDALLVASTAHLPYVVKTPDGKVWIITAEGRWHVPDRETLDVLIYLGQVQGFGSAGPARVTLDAIDGIPVLAKI